MRWLEIVTVCDARVEIPTGELQPGRRPGACRTGEVMGWQGGARAAAVRGRGRPAERREAVAAHGADLERNPATVPPHGARQRRRVLSGVGGEGRRLEVVRQGNVPAGRETQGQLDAGAEMQRAAVAPPDVGGVAGIGIERYPPRRDPGDAPLELPGAGALPPTGRPPRGGPPPPVFPPPPTPRHGGPRPRPG